jgi:exonuclease VII small subunit
MAEPTLKDVLAAIARLEKGQARLEKGQARLEGGQAHLEKGQAELRAEMTKRFDDLDAELTTHAKVHRKIEDDIRALKGRPPRTAARPTRRPRAR